MIGRCWAEVVVRKEMQKGRVEEGTHRWTTSFAANVKSEAIGVCKVSGRV